MEFKVNKKENFYFTLRVIFSLVGLLLICGIITSLGKIGSYASATSVFLVLFYAVIIFLYIKLVQIFMIGHLKGNGVQITEKQFPEVYRMIIEIAQSYHMKKIPDVFLIQSGGILNAYATRFVGKNYIAIYSEIFSIVNQESAVLKFILAHEMAHIKRSHLQKRFWTILSVWVPFLGSAYSRSCEYTCDNFGNAVAPAGSKNGLVMLAAGRELYKQINIDQYLEDAEKNNSGSVKFTGIFLSHPNLPKRIRNISK